MTAALPPSNWIVHATDENFETEVFERSKQTLVVLDFWAEWCGPCRQLTPILEKVVEQFEGQFVLVKANTDQAPMAAQQFSVASIPTVLAIFDKQIINAFEGALPERAISTWIDKSLTTVRVRQVIQLADNDPHNAESQLQSLRTEFPREREVAIALLKVLLKLEKSEECQLLVDELEREAPLEVEAQKIKSALKLASKSSVDFESVQATAAAEPKNWTAQLALAEALVGKQDYQAAFEICLNLVQMDRKQTGEQARALMVDVFRTLPDDSPLTSEYRRKLASALY